MSYRRQVNRLFPETIDEVSSVDSPACQLGLIAITKRAGDDVMDFFDADGNPVDAVDLANLEPGDTVYNAAGRAYEAKTDDELDELLDGGQVHEDDIVDLEAAFDLDDADPRHGEEEGVDNDDRERELALAGVGKRAGLGRTEVRGRGTAGVSGGNGSQTEAGRRHRRLGEPGRRFGKSAGEQVLEELRKAATDEHRDVILARALDGIDEANRTARQALGLVQKMASSADGDRYVELAKSYDVPVEPTELGGILQRVSGVLSKRQLDTFERILTAAGDSENFREIGYNGAGGGSDVLGQVTAMAGEVVTKAAGGVSVEQAVTEIFSANPDAYAEYEAERYG